jgi:hypothetical protein
MDAERVRAAEDRLRIESLGAGVRPASVVPRRVRRALAPAVRAIRRRARRRAGDVTGPAKDPRGGWRIAISIAAPLDKIAARWGDWHFAAALARALEQAGHVAYVQTKERLSDGTGPPFDLRIVLRGLERVPPTAGTPHVLWVISHPESIGVDECDEADLVLVASHRFADELRRRTATPVEVLLQATDHHRFRPLPPDPHHVHDVVAVAKTRDVPRRIVMDAIAAGLSPAIYGTGWEAFVDPSLIAGQYVTNRELPVVYSSAGVVLSDQWDTMHDWGFVSNRLFDVLACGVPVISNEQAAVTDLFEGAVLEYRTPAELRELADGCLTNDGEARERVERGRQIVLDGHTFDHRVARLDQLLASHDLVPPRGGSPR